MDIATAKLTYMIAHLRRLSFLNPATWSINEVIETFNTVREPEIPFTDWISRTGIDIKDPKEEANAAAIAIIKSSNDPAVKKD